MKEYLLGAAAIVLAGAAVAQTSAPQPMPGMPQGMAAPRAAPMDRVQTRDEVVAKVRERFARLDSNRDGYLTKAEADAGRALFKDRIREKRGARRADRVQQRDPAVAFDRLDANKDGAISRDEFGRAREQRGERRMVMKDGKPGAAPGRGEPLGGNVYMHRMGGGMIGGQMFAMADANKDGRVSLQEATDSAVRHFDMADANRDGQVTPDERRQMHRQMMEKHRAPKAG